MIYMYESSGSFVLSECNYIVCKHWFVKKISSEKSTTKYRAQWHERKAYSFCYKASVTKRNNKASSERYNDRNLFF